MKKTILCTAAILSLSVIGSPVPAFASDDGEERTRHYEVAPPKTQQEAITLLEDNLDKTEKAIAAGDMHAVHENSYAIEAAIFTLRKTGSPSTHKKLSALYDLNEEVHEASEEDETDVVAREFAALKTAWGALRKHY